MPQQPYDTPVPDGGAKPFRVALPESLLTDLRQRLDRTRWPDEIPGSGWSYGTSLPYAKELAAYWKDEYETSRIAARDVSRCFALLTWVSAKTSVKTPQRHAGCLTVIRYSINMLNI